MYIASSKTNHFACCRSPIRPVVWDCLKQQQGATGRVGYRQHAKWFVFEEAAYTHEPTEDSAGTYDYSRPGTPYEGDPELNQYVVARHPKGAVEAFSLRWFREINAAAERTGQDGYAEVMRVTGVEKAVAEMEKERKGHGR